MYWLKALDKQSVQPVYQQIKNTINTAVNLGILQPGQKLPSINKICNEFQLAPGTVIRAYNELREAGIVTSRQGKGYFISTVQPEPKIKVFLLFDRMNAFKEILYESFREEFSEETDIQVFFHHYNAKRFEKLVRENSGKFSHYVLMPHLQGNIQKAIQRIPEKHLIFIDNFPLNLKTNANAVYQSFYNDIFTALQSQLERVKKYKSINLSLSPSQFQFVPPETQKGFQDFCKKHNIQHHILQTINKENLNKNCLYIIFDDGELIRTLKYIQKKNWQLKNDIGIISFDESPMKKLIAGGISVLSTDFKEMGKTAAKLVKGELNGKYPNPFKLTYRNSF